MLGHLYDPPFYFCWSASESSSASGASSASSTVKKDTENGKKEVEVKQKIGEVSPPGLERNVFFLYFRSVSNSYLDFQI
jgi:hypothetical protein